MLKHEHPPFNHNLSTFFQPFSCNKFLFIKYNAQLHIEYHSVYVIRCISDCVH
jgi:hypothetical protein